LRVGNGGNDGGAGDGDGCGGGGGVTRCVFDDDIVKLKAVFGEFQFGAFLVSELYDLVEHFLGIIWMAGEMNVGRIKKPKKLGTLTEG